MVILSGLSSARIWFDVDDECVFAISILILLCSAVSIHSIAGNSNISWVSFRWNVGIKEILFYKFPNQFRNNRFSNNKNRSSSVAKWKRTFRIGWIGSLFFVVAQIRIIVKWWFEIGIAIFYCVYFVNRLYVGGEKQLPNWAPIISGDFINSALFHIDLYVNGARFDWSRSVRRSRRKSGRTHVKFPDVDVEEITIKRKPKFNRIPIHRHLLIYLFISEQNPTTKRGDSTRRKSLS